MSDPLIAPLVGESPLRALMRARLSTRTDTALVFVTAGGAYRQSVPRPHRARAGSRSVRVAQLLSRSFAQIYRVRLAEQALTFNVPLPCRDERAVVLADVQLVARVHDPALVVEQRIIDPEPYIRTNIQAQMREITSEHTVETLPEAERQIGNVLSRVEPFRLPELGMSYGPGHVRFRLQGGPLGGIGGGLHAGGSVQERAFAPVTPAAYDGTATLGEPITSDPAPWLRLRQQELEFYKDLVADGPRSLIAFWLREHPEAIKEIIEWVSGNQAAAQPDPEVDSAGEDPAPDSLESGPEELRSTHARAALDMPAEAELYEAMQSILSRGGYTARQLRSLSEELGMDGTFTRAEPEGQHASWNQRGPD